MPKRGMEPIRRKALVEATIAEIGGAGSLDVTVSQIAKRAGMSSALAHHYFGGKDEIFLATIRHVLRRYQATVLEALASATTPVERLQALIAASFAQESFRQEVISAWMSFYVLAQKHPEARRLLWAYQMRLRSNLRHDFAAAGVADPLAAAERIAAMIDGVYLKQALSSVAPDPGGAVVQLEGALRAELSETEHMGMGAET